MGIDGKNVLRGTSPLRDRLGQQIAGPRLTIKDDPFIDCSPLSGAFEDEGTPGQVPSIIQQGVLQNFIYDRDTAGRLGVQPTGHGTSRALTNLVIEPGESPYEEMVKGVKEGLLVHSFLGMG